MKCYSALQNNHLLIMFEGQFFFNVIYLVTFSRLSHLLYVVLQLKKICLEYLIQFFWWDWVLFDLKFVCKLLTGAFKSFFFQVGLRGFVSLKFAFCKVFFCLFTIWGLHVSSKCAFLSLNILLVWWGESWISLWTQIHPFLFCHWSHSSTIQSFMSVG